ncbi:MAG: hypothetical protein WCG87_12370 [Bacteroidota bacterium]
MNSKTDYQGIATISFIIFMTFFALLFSSCQNTWRVGRTYYNSNKTTQYKIDSLSGDLGIYRIGLDTKSGISGSHFFKIKAYHDAWVELDTIGTNAQQVSATVFKSKMTFSEKYIAAGCNPCVLTDTAFEIYNLPKK